MVSEFRKKQSQCEAYSDGNQQQNSLKLKPIAGEFHDELTETDAFNKCNRAKARSK